MDPSRVTNLIVLVILLILSCFFSGSETALTTVSRIKIEPLLKGDGVVAKRAGRVLRIIDDKSKMLSAILIGNNLVNIFASALATALAMDYLGSVGIGVATGILTLLILVFGEITPKSYAQANAVKISLMVSGVILLLMTILTPVIFIINSFVNGFLFILGVRGKEETEGMTSEEFITAVNISHEKGNIEEDEKDYIENIFDFSTSTAKEVMTPRIDVTAINIDWSYEKILEVFSENMYTRYPVYESSGEKVRGILNIKDLLLYNPEKPFLLEDFVREAYLTFELKNTSDLFEEMRVNSISMAIVMDEYGNMAGILTLEDLLEELVGEIRDEFDDDEVDDIRRISDRDFEVLGSANLEDTCDELSLDFESDDYDTIGGYLVGLFDHFPKVGETYVTGDGIILKVTATSQNRVEKVRIRFPKGQKGKMHEEKPELG